MLACWRVGMLACWHVGVLACWRVGVLACWHVGVLACWRVGVLACWRVGVLACWHVGMLACWHVGMLACWHVGMLACWHVGMLACWHVAMLPCSLGQVVQSLNSPFFPPHYFGREERGVQGLDYRPGWKAKERSGLFPVSNHEGFNFRYHYRSGVELNFHPPPHLFLLCSKFSELSGF